MKVRINTGFFGGKVEVNPRQTVIYKQGGDFAVFMEEVKDPAVRRIIVSPLDVQIEQEDGWTICIRRGIHEKGHLIITRSKESKGESPIEEYLAAGGKWLPCSSGFHSLYPPDIMKIPILTLKKSPV